MTTTKSNWWQSENSCKPSTNLQSAACRKGDVHSSQQFKCLLLPRQPGGKACTHVSAREALYALLLQAYL